MAAGWTYQDLVKDALSRITEVSCETLKARLDRADTPVMLDIREREEIGDGMLPGATFLPRGLIEKHVHEHAPKKSAEVILYCDTGKRSALAADVMTKMGYDKVSSLEGGIQKWRHLGYGIEGQQAAVCLLSGAKLNWADIRREFAIVARRVPVLGTGEKRLVYLDHAASTHAPLSVMNAYVDFLQHEYANVHRGTHHLSRKSTERFEECYYVIADFIGAELKSGAVCFTTNTTQAIDLASHIMAHRPGKVVTTEMEHHSNELPHRRRGTVLRARVRDDGTLDLDHLEELLRRNEVKLVAVTAAANVTGIMNDLHRVARLAHENGALVLVDAAQVLAHHPIDVKPFDHPEHLDFVAGAGHKAYAPFGAGFLYGPRAIMNEAPPYVPGGGTASQVTVAGAEFMPAPDRHQGGTPNIAGVVAMSRAFLFLQSIGLEEIRRHELQLLEQAVSGLSSMGGITIYGDPNPAHRLGVISFNVQDVADQMTAAVLSEEGGVAVRNGRFCAHIYMDRLLSTHHAELPKSQVPRGAVRASFGLYNDASDVEQFLSYVDRVKNRRWVGRYQQRGSEMNAEFAGRCADTWMEASADSEASHEHNPSLGYTFVPLHSDDVNRAYLIIDEDSREAAIVDPVRERVDEYLDVLLERGVKLKYTIETHTHADHIAASARLKDLTGCQMLMHKTSPAPCVDRGLDEGDVIVVGSVKIEVMATPGHTQDCICLLLPDRVLTGDTLLIGSCGRTDLPTGDARTLFQSLQRLKALPEDTMVFPGHDYKGQRASTIGRERKNNPRLQIENEEAFMETMGRLSIPPPVKLQESLNANQKCL